MRKLKFVIAYFVLFTLAFGLSSVRTNAEEHSNIIQPSVMSNEIEDIGGVSWINSIFKVEDSYDVINMNGESVLNEFIENNKTNYLSGAFNLIDDYAHINNLSYAKKSCSIQKNISTYVSVPMKCTEFFRDNRTSSGVNITAETALEVTVRFNDGTGKITSYGQPTLYVQWIAVPPVNNTAYHGYVQAINTSASLSSSKSMLTASTSYDLVAKTTGGFDKPITISGNHHSLTCPK